MSQTPFPHPRYVRRELAQLMPDHVFRDGDGQIVLAVMNLKVEPDKVGQDRGGPGLRAHWGHLVAGLFGPHNGQTAVEYVLEGFKSFFFLRVSWSYGTRLGPKETVNSVSRTRSERLGQGHSYPSIRSASGAILWAASWLVWDWTADEACKLNQLWSRCWLDLDHVMPRLLRVACPA